MVSSQDVAWIIYTILLLLEGAALAARSPRNLLLLPFVVFALLSAVAHIIMIVRNYEGDTLVLLADRSVVTNSMPIFSFLLYAGIVACQLAYYVQHTSAQPNEAASEKRLAYLVSGARRQPPVYWAIIGLLLVYGCLVLAFVCVRVTRDDDLSATRWSLASLVSAMLALALCNSVLVMCYRPQRPAHLVRWSKQQRRLVCAVMFLFIVCMTGMTTEAWLLYGMLQDRRADYLSAVPGGWIALETLLVYLPIYIILAIFIVIRHVHGDHPEREQSPSSAAVAAGPRSLHFLWQSKNHRHHLDDAAV